MAGWRMEARARARRKISPDGLTISAMAVLTALAAGPAQAQKDCTVAPQAKCGATISRECLSSLGAGAMALGEVESCAAQMKGYRECLEKVAGSCPKAPQQDVNQQADRLAELARLGGLIDEPKTVVEYYNNALVYARRGDLLNGRVMLEKAIADGARHVDLFQRYAQVLKAQEGVVGAREIMRDVARRSPDNQAAALAEAVLRPAPQREAALRALAEQGFGPAHYEISQLYSADRLGDRSLGDQRAEKAALVAFAEADERGGVYRWFLEKDTVEVWRESARRRLALYRNRNLDVAPVTLTATPSNDGWIVNLQLVELARRIHYSVDGGPKKSTGETSAIHPQTGEKTPYSFITLPLGAERAEITVWYDNIRGEEEGPFPVTFDADSAFLASSKQLLGTLIQKWVEGRAWDEGSQLVYFTTLVTQSCGLAKIEYGADKATPDTVFPLPPCDPERPGAIGADTETYLRFAKPLASMSVRLTYSDGSQSEVREFRF